MPEAPPPRLAPRVCSIFRLLPSSLRLGGCGFIWEPICAMICMSLKRAAFSSVDVSKAEAWRPAFARVEDWLYTI